MKLKVSTFCNRIEDSLLVSLVVVVSSINFYNKSTIFSSLSTITLTACILALHRVLDSRLTVFVTAFFKNSHFTMGVIKKICNKVGMVKHEKKRYMFLIIPKHNTTIGSYLTAVTPTKFNEWLSQFTNNVL